MSILSSIQLQQMLVILVFSMVSTSLISQAEKIRVLIIDGENNHGAWPMTTVMMKDYLEDSDLFTVSVARKKYTWQGPHNNTSIGEDRIRALIEEFPVPGLAPTTKVEEPKYDPDFNPDFTNYQVVISNLGWKASDWPEHTKKAFEEYIYAGGSLVVVHAANNSFGNWSAYNEMIGLGGWDGRSVKDGPYVYYNEEGQLIRDPGEGDCGSHGAQQPFLITVRNNDHPITKGLPLTWLHAKDELYDRLRGPALNMEILATAYSHPEKNSPPWNNAVKGSGRHEPMLLITNFGKGRIFHTVMGHTDYSMECVGFITTFLRGVEWAATGQVSQSDLPEDFPGSTKVSQRTWKQK